MMTEYSSEKYDILSNIAKTPNMTVAVCGCENSDTSQERCMYPALDHSREET